MEKPRNLSDPQEVRLHNIIDMGLTFSAMIRLFERGSKKRLHQQIIVMMRKLAGVDSEEHFIDLHSDFCDWGTKNLLLAEKRRRGRIIKRANLASYGQIAKTLDVVLKVAVYYSHLPDCEKASKMWRWLNAAVDTKMMAKLKEHYPDDFQPWPGTIEQVKKKSTYMAIQKIVRKFISEKHDNDILPVQFDDIYWKELNR